MAHFICNNNLDELRNLAANLKLAVFDIDGTLIGSDGRYSQKTKEAIEFLQRRNILTAIASGRPPYAAAFLCEELKLDSLGSFFAGAMLYDPSRKLSIRTHFLAGSAQNLLAEIQSTNLHCEVYTETDYWIESTTDIYEEHRRALRTDARRAKLQNVIANEKVVKLLTVEDRRFVDESTSTLTQMENKYPEYQFAYAQMASHPHWRFASIVSGESDRYSAFNELCEYYNITANQVIAFGDAQSDQAFIQSAGIGVAMGDAPQQVKDGADLVTGTVSEEGVATAIELLFATD